MTFARGSMLYLPGARLSKGDTGGTSNSRYVLFATTTTHDPGSILKPSVARPPVWWSVHFLPVSKRPTVSGVIGPHHVSVSEMCRFPVRTGQSYRWYDLGEETAPQLLTGALGNVSGTTTLCDSSYVAFSPRGYRTLLLPAIEQPVRRQSHDHDGLASFPRLSRINAKGWQAPLFLCSKARTG